MNLRTFARAVAAVMLAGNVSAEVIKCQFQGVGTNLNHNVGPVSGSFEINWDGRLGVPHMRAPRASTKPLII
jgi:hypothetical protein